jgi:hypothetical protein
LTINRSTMNRAIAGRATRMPTVAMIFAASPAPARARKISRSSTSPSAGANTSTDTSAAGTIGQPRLVWSWK